MIWPAEMTAVPWVGVLTVVMVSGSPFASVSLASTSNVVGAVAELVMLSAAATGAALPTVRVTEAVSVPPFPSLIA